MKTRFISFFLVAFLIFTTLLPAHAENLTTEGRDDVVVTIPADFTIDDSNKAEAIVAAENVLLPYGKTLNVKVTGDDYVDAWELIDAAEDTNRLVYTIGTTDGADDIASGDVVLDVASGEAPSSKVEETLFFTVTDTVTKAGTYNDTLTFTVSVD